MFSSFLKLTFSGNENQNAPINNLEYRNKPFSNSPIFCANVQNFKQLTYGTDVKTVYQLDLSFKNIEYDILPGDTIALLPENDENEVNELLVRLNIESLCYKEYYLEVLKETTKKNAVIPKHLPPSSTLHNVFLKHIDIRTPPKKLFLKNLIKYTTDELEKDKLEMICSPAGSQEYTKLLTTNKTLLSLLNAFPSCFPPIEMILEHSTPLNPRYYSIASSPLERNIISIIFFVMELENGLKGVCTSWLQKLLQENELKSANIPFYFRKPGDFRFYNMENPSILVATGTGLAPFRGFLQHKMLNNNLQEIWLFYGCRYPERDFLCKEELENYLKTGVLTKLYTAFSRDSKKKVYIQQKILDHKEDVTNLILNKGATVFVCGDAKTVVRDVRETIIQLFTDYGNTDRPTAEDIIDNLVKNKRYLVDSWV